MKGQTLVTTYPDDFDNDISYVLYVETPSIILNSIRFKLKKMNSTKSFKMNWVFHIQQISSQLQVPSSLGSSLWFLAREY